MARALKWCLCSMDVTSAIALLSVAAGVADEVSHPARVVKWNLHYLLEVEGEDLTEEGRQALRDAIRAMQRIDSIVGQLVDTARRAVSAEEPGGVALRDAAEEAPGAARARRGELRIESRAREELRAVVELSPASAPEQARARATSSVAGDAPGAANGRPRLFLVVDDRDEADPPNSS